MHLPAATKFVVPRSWEAWSLEPFLAPHARR